MFYEQIAKNKRKTIVIVIAYLLLFICIGGAIGYLSMRNILAGCIIALIVGLIYVLVTLKNATAIVMKLNHAQEITQKIHYPMLWNIVGDMCMVAQVPKPRLFIIEDDSPNAFASGVSPDKAAVAVTTGLLNTLNREEIEGVIAHEFAHIKNYDVRLQTCLIALNLAIALILQVVRFTPLFNQTKKKSNDTNIVMLIASFVLIILGPILMSVMTFTLSRNREYLADATAVSFTRNPLGLISALDKISQSEPMQNVSLESASLYISNPLKPKETAGIFDTHPPISERIERLKNM